MTDHIKLAAASLQIQPAQVSAAVELLDQGNTIPFIARYRKEVTRGLDEEQLRQIEAEINRLRNLDTRRTAILSSIEEQGKMTDELKTQILSATTMIALEDLYAPYKPKRRTRASIAREKGLQKLADMIQQQIITKDSLEKLAQPFISDTVFSVQEALDGARDIVAENISDHPEIRRQVREKAMRWGLIICRKKSDAEDSRMVYQTYYEFQMLADRLKPYQVLAIDRGESEKVLTVTLDVAEKDWMGVIVRYFRPEPRSVFHEQLVLTIQDAAERLLLPSIERDIRQALKEKSESHAIQVFASNLRGLLSQPMLAGHVVMGIDPGFRTGSKVAVIDPTGKVLDTITIYPHEPQKKYQESLAILKSLIDKYHVTLISIGNGTASRETEQLAAELTKGQKNLHYIITNEAGASVYSASPLARSELPGLDVSMRGAVSIARRVQDPLAELVKIDPKSIGVGMYQHDVNQAQLAKTLDGVVESVVNQVGVDVNTASPALLSSVAGIGPKLAEKIVAFRDQEGAFKSREELKKVPGLGPKAFEQSAGFLRIRDGVNLLDASAIHPESYPVAENLIKLLEISIKSTPEDKKKALDKLKKNYKLEDLASSLNTGVPTLVDIMDQLVRPGRDPRLDMPVPILRTDVLSMEDLKEGMIMKGTVRNVVDFGVFVDIGVKQDGLIHRSQIPTGTILQVGEVIQVEIIKVEKERGRISLKIPGDL